MVNGKKESFPETEVRMALKEDLWQIRELAQRIFPATYQHIVPVDQIDYMMELFYAPEALLKQMESGQTFLIIFYTGRPAGYASYTRLDKGSDFRLNKIYLDFNLQGKGLGKLLLLDTIGRIKSLGGRSLRLNVNRFNKAVGFYRKMGFSVVHEELLDMGGGHFMDDFVMGINI